MVGTEGSELELELDGGAELPELMPELLCNPEPRDELLDLALELLDREL